MTDDRDTTAAQRLATELASPGPHHFAAADVRTVLADREDMRGRLLHIIAIVNAMEEPRSNAAAYAPAYLRQIRELADTRRLVRPWHDTDPAEPA